MGEYFRARMASEQIKKVFESMHNDIFESECLCVDGVTFDDKENPEWEDRYKHIVQKYTDILDTFRDYLKDTHELYELKSQVEVGILKKMLPKTA